MAFRQFKTFDSEEELNLFLKFINRKDNHTSINNASFDIIDDAKNKKNHFIFNLTDVVVNNLNKESKIIDQLILDEINVLIQSKMKNINFNKVGLIKIQNDNLYFTILKIINNGMYNFYIYFHGTMNKIKISDDETCILNVQLNQPNKLSIGIHTNDKCNVYTLTFMLSFNDFDNFYEMTTSIS